MKAVVIGGGIAGLVAAVELARGGARVTLLERAVEPGGRGGSRELGGAWLNFGPHALYEAGPAGEILTDLGIEVPGGAPPLRRFRMLHDGDLVPAPFTPWALASSSQLTITQKWEVTRFLALLHTIDARHWERRTLGELLDRYTSTPLTRRLLKMFVAIATFGHSNQMSAGVALRQLKVGLAGVRYPDGGFQSIVDGLVRVAEETGVDLRCGVAATGVRRGQVATSQRSLNADAIVLAVPPHVAEKLADVEFGPRRATRMATLDVVLDQAPRAPDNVIDLERAIYLSFHSPVAELGDGVVLHSAKYLDPFAPFDADAARAEVESLLDRAQPGWRDQVSYVRFLPRIAVNHWFCDAESGGQPGRPDVSLCDGIYVAGDWVGDEGMLTDAAMASGRRAALVALEDQRRAAA